MNINESFKSYKSQDLEVVYKLKLDGENTYSDRRVIWKSSNSMEIINMAMLWLSHSS